MTDKKYEVVISGLSGQYPECENVEELWDKLMNKQDMVTIDGRKWVPGEFDVPSGTGKIPHPEHFDMTFFGIHRKLCEKMDPYTRLLCEQGYRAICDAGVNPRDLEGTNTAVIMSSYTSEPELDLGASLINQGSYNILAFSRTMQANRLSYFLNVKGPSFQMDNSSCGGIQAIQYACDLISTGMCTAAIVGACSLLYKAEGSFHYLMMGRLSDDCMTRSFSSDASGYARSEGCVSVFLQRKDHARRIYGTVLGANVFCFGNKDDHLPAFPRGLYDKFLVETYEKFNVNPKDLVYVEAHGAASKTLDALELNGLSKALVKQRSNPLLIGSIKSNVGFTEGASSMVSLSKALMALDRGIIPPNINYREPNPDIPDLVAGKLKVVTEPTPIQGGTIAVSELGVTGNYAHIILKGNEKVKPSEIKDGAKCPHLVIMSGRNENALASNMLNLDKIEIDGDYVLLLNSLYKEGIKNHVYRGYSVITGEPNTYTAIGPAPGGEKKPIWFMYSGMGSQWPTMAKTLMALPIFADAIHKCHKVLEPKGVNLLDVVCKDDPTIFDNILNCFVGIAAVQIGLTDVLKAIGIEPDGIIGHSVGELGCAYADGCMTAEQMILAAHARGRASVEATLIKGMMAAVGAGYNQMKNILPETIEVACHNSKDSCTLSGPADDMDAFIEQLKAKGLFAKLVNVANIAYHSRYIKPAAPALLKYLKEIIPVPVKRSSKWVSSSNLESNWNTDLAQHSSAEYHTNNLLSSVLFEEASRHIPSDAIVIEVAPHGLLQAIVKRSLHQAVNIPLTSRFDPNNLMFLLGAIGKMFIAGIPVDLKAFYPSADFPVSRGTPSISPLIDWSREVDFAIKRVIDDPDAPSSYCRYVKVDRSIDDYDLLTSQKINGRTTLPLSFYFSEMIDHFTSLGNNDGTPLVMEKIKILRHFEITSNTTEVRFKLLQGGGNVVVSDNETSEILLEGNIKAIDSKLVKELTAPEVTVQSLKTIKYEDIVSFMKFAGIERASPLMSLDNVVMGDKRAWGTVKWEGDIGRFLMSLLLLIEFVESKSKNILKLFHSAGEILVDLPRLTKTNSQGFIVEYDFLSRKLQCEGVKIAFVECRNPGLSQGNDDDFFISFEHPQFMPYANKNAISYEECVNTCTQLILENSSVADDTVLLITGIGLNPALLTALKEIPESARYAVQTSLSSFPNEESFLLQCSSSLLEKLLWIVYADPPSSAAINSIATIRKGFLLCPKDPEGVLEKTYQVIFETEVDGKLLNLFAIRKSVKRQYEVVNFSSDYLGILQNQLLMTDLETEGDDVVKTVILWGQVDSLVTVYNIMEETKELQNGQLLHYWLFYGDGHEVDFNDDKFKSQIVRDVRVNILMDGQWGSLRFIPSTADNKAVSTARPSKFYYPLSAVAKLENISALGLNMDDNPGDVSISELGVYDYVSSMDKLGVGCYNPDSKSFIPDKILCWQKPSQWSSIEAATVPLLYSLASYVLYHTNNAMFTYKNSILVNRALLPLSQAVISLGLNENMEVHATVYGEEEKQILLSLFPKLNPDLIYDCNSVAFFVEVLKNSNGGVYKVINSFDDPIMIEPCAECVLPLGVLIYTSQTLINNGAAMGMRKFDYEIVARVVSADVMVNSSDETKLEIRNNINQAIKSGGLTPIKSIAYLPPSTLNTNAALYLKSNVNKVIVDTKDIDNTKFFQIGTKTQVVVEGKIQFDFCLDILEWLLKRGSRKVLLFSRRSHSLEENSLRLQSLREQYKYADIEVRPSNQLSTMLQVERFVEDYSNPAMVFFLGSGLKERVEFFDEVLSKKLPSCNMIFIGKGSEAVYERRKKKSLPSLYIRCSTTNLEGVHLTHYLDSLIESSSKTAVVLRRVKKCDVQTRGLLAKFAYLPEKRELGQLMSQSKVSRASFVSIPSAGPPAHQAREVYPMFFIPGLRPNRLHKLASQLFCPVMEARIPSSVSSIDQIANDLANQLLALSHNMFTLCAESWGGILALHVAAKLEGKSKYVNVILLDATPASVCKWANSILTNEIVLFRRYLHLPIEIEFNNDSGWEDKLNFAVGNSPLRDEDQKTLAINCLNLLKKRLHSVVDTKLPSKLKAKCHVFGLRSQAHEDHGLGEYLLNEPNFHSKDSKTSDDMMDEDVATEVNSLLLYEYKDAANPPIEEYLCCNIVKKCLPHWQSTLLYRER